MQLQQLRYVIKVAEKENFSRAADALFITQPTLSQQIKSLEEELQVKLFVRQPKRITLTDAGEAFVSYAKRIINEVDGLSQTMESYASQTKGSIRIGALWIFGYLGISDHIAAFRELHPEVDVSIAVNGSRKLLEMVLERSIDAAYLSATEKELTHPELESYQVQCCEVMAVIPKNHPLAGEETIHMEQLDGEKLILPDPDSHLRKLLMAHLGKAMVFPRVVCESPQPDVIVTSAANDIGISFLSADLAKAFPDKRVVYKPLAEPLYRSVYFVTLKSLRDLPTIGKLTNHVRSTWT